VRPVHDVIVRGGRVIDGAGNPAVAADVGVQDGRIVAVGNLPHDHAETIVDAQGLFVCPGFIDMHTHSDLPILVDPKHEAKVRQGITLDVLGQDGLGYAPLSEQILPELMILLRDWNGDPGDVEIDWRTVDEYVERMSWGAAVNTAFLAPHGNIRLEVIGLEERAPTEAELQEMRRLVSECMSCGAVGLSAGLQYVPSMFAEEDELVSLCEVVASFGGYFAPHHRGYGRDAMAAYAECLRIAERARVSLHLTHAHLSYPVNAGRATELLEVVDGARSAGLDVTLDTYPYVSGNPYLRILLPQWMLSGGKEQTLARLRDRDDQDRLRVALEVEGFEGVPVDWTRLEVSSVHNPANKRWIGLSIQQAADATGSSAFEFFCGLLVSDDLHVSVLEHVGNEDNVREIMKHVAHMAGSDGILVGDRPHPRGWGTFPRYLGHYVRDLGVLTWEQAIRKMTSLPAQRLGLWDRGLVRPGMAADIVCFDPHSVRETGTFAEPRSFPEGIPHVIVNGVPVVSDGVHTGQLPGQMLLRGRPRLGERHDARRSDGELALGESRS
jgi:N-acyl-D-amino-acid deacylase